MEVKIHSQIADPNTARVKTAIPDSSWAGPKARCPHQTRKHNSRTAVMMAARWRRCSRSLGRACGWWGLGGAVVAYRTTSLTLPPPVRH